MVKQASGTLNSKGVHRRYNCRATEQFVQNIIALGLTKNASHAD